VNTVLKSKPSLMILLFGLLLGTQVAVAQNHAIKMEKPNEGSTSYRSHFLMGISGGNFMVLQDDDANILPDHLGKITIHSGYAFTATSVLLADINLGLPNGMWGANLVYQQSLFPFEISPFIGAGGGYHYILADESNINFGERLCGSITANAGIELFRLQQARVRIRLNYDLLINAQTHHVVGADIGFLYRFGTPGIRELKID
jgi:hypothetical protein